VSQTLVLFLRKRRRNEHHRDARQLRILANRQAELKAIQARHQDVAQYGMRAGVAGLLQCLHAVGGGSDLKT